MSLRHAWVLSGAALLLAGCELKSPAGEPAPVELPAASEPSSVIPEVPALYAGVLPCADCAGIRYELDLRPRNVYFLRTTYIGTEPDATFDDIGRWSLSESQAIIVLRGGRAAPELFAIEDAVTLRKRDIDGDEIESGLNYDITLQPSYMPLEPSLRLRGMYRAADDAGEASYEECLTGLALTVSQGGDHAALRQAYEAVRSEPRQRVLTILEGRIVQRPVASGPAMQDTLIVEKSGTLRPEETCESPGEEDGAED